MSRRLPNPRVLLVEGDEDKRAIPYLVEANGLRWGERDEPKLVDIESYDGIDKLLAPGEIETVLKRSHLRCLGILVDADEDATVRYRALRARCTALPEHPAGLPAEGIITQDPEGRRIGVWLMPDNSSRGMLETFLSLLRPAGKEPLWQHAQDAHQKARHLGATCREAHEHKAQIHTWLAWQDPPGRQLHQALLERILDPRSPQAANFMSWFRGLYEL
jgi:hypothetical protein